MPRFFNAYTRLSRLALTVGAVAIQPPAVVAATITVDDGFVAPADDGNCSLVEAFDNANTNAQLNASAGECAAGREPTGVVVNTDITLQGNGSTISRDPGAADFHLIAVLDRVNSNLFVSDVTFPGGKDDRGGALYNDGGNGGAIFTDHTATTTVTNSRATGTTATGSGGLTAGKWIRVLDGSAQGMPRNSTGDFSLSDDGRALYLTTKGRFDVDNAAGGHSMVYAYDLGTQTFSGPLFIAADEGLAQKVDGLQVEGGLP